MGEGGGRPGFLSFDANHNVESHNEEKKRGGEGGRVCVRPPDVEFSLFFLSHTFFFPRSRSQQAGELPASTVVNALLIGQIDVSLAPPFAIIAAASPIQDAATVEGTSQEKASYKHHISTTAAAAATHLPSIRIGVITVSDRVSKGEMEDKSTVTRRPSSFSFSLSFSNILMCIYMCTSPSAAYGCQLHPSCTGNKEPY